MNKTIAYLAFCVIICFLAKTDWLMAEIGDTLKVETITFDSLMNQQAGWYDFPDTSSPKRFEKIMLNYKLRMPTSDVGGYDSRWDYDKYVYVCQFFVPNFTVNLKKYDSYSYIKNPSWKYSAKKDSITGALVVDSVQDAAKRLDYYNDPENPSKSTQSLYIWTPYWRYTFQLVDSSGTNVVRKLDSAYIDKDTTIYLSKVTRVYFKDSVTYAEKYEIFRYIILYGNGVYLGAGVNWQMDVSDYRKFLSGKVYLEAHLINNDNPRKLMEKLDLSFDFIEGIPPRDLIDTKRIINISGGAYNNLFNEKFLKPINITISEPAKMARLKIVQTGHGNNGEGCGEFCKKNATLKLNDSLVSLRAIWKGCAMNAIFPQGGNWVSDRANWCPGELVEQFNYELSPFVNFNQNNIISYKMDSVDYTNAGGANWRIQGYLATYKAPNFTNDASMIEIIAPNSNPQYSRFNPCSTNPIVIIQNTGSQDLSSLDIKYGIKDVKQYTYHWTGKILKFLEKDTVYLPLLDYNDWNSSSNTFEANVSTPNNVNDEYSINNSISRKFTIAKEFPSKLIISFSIKNTDTLAKYIGYNLADLNKAFRYYILDANGAIIHSILESSPNSTKLDTLNLAPGSYKCVAQSLIGLGFGFVMYNPYYDQNTGTKIFDWTKGSLKFLNNKTTVFTVQPDFGEEYSFDFRVKPTIDGIENFSQNSLNLSLSLESNDLKNSAKLHWSINDASDNSAIITLCDNLGKEIEVLFSGKANDGENETIINTNQLSSGIFYATLKSNGLVKTLMIPVVK